ncbi:telomere length regulation protein TEL2 homolog [Amblyomma americanum]
MGEHARLSSEAAELAHKLLSHVALGEKTADIQRILNLPPESTLCSADASLYCHFVTALLDNLSANALRNAEEERMFDALVMRCPPEDLLLVLASALRRYSKSYRLDKGTVLLSAFVQGGHLYRLLVGQCHRDASGQSDESSWPALETILVSLPERVVNSRAQNIPDVLTPREYFVSLLNCILRALCHARDEVNRCVDIHVVFLSRLLGRVCTIGQSELVEKQFVPKLVLQCQSDFIFRRICCKIVTCVPDSCLENVIVVLLSALNDYNHVDWFMADSVCTHSKLKYLLATKLPLMRTFSKVTILQNLVGYLASSERRRPIFLDLVKEILSVWGDKTLMKHQSEQQQKYLTSALMISLGHIKITGCGKATADSIMSKLLHGVGSHIASPEEWIRTYGMIVAEQFTAVLQPDGPKLNFEYKLDDDISDLLSLTDVTTKRQDPHIKESLEEVISTEEVKPKAAKANLVQDELDSDDDLEPFDMSHDTPNASKKPMYLRDCMEGLLEQENKDWMESCLKTVSNLIQTCKDELQDVAEELSKILLYLDDKFCTASFDALRHQALVTLAVNSPKTVATYLTDQFYDRNLNIRQRLDILEVLALASNQLASAKAPPTPPRVERTVSNITDTHWKTVVMERVKAKTRIISKGRATTVEPTKNRFSDVAGYFFYPLMSYYDRKENTFDLLGEDSFVLARLIATLGIVQDSAANCPRSAHMAVCLLEFLSALKYHTDACVRDAILFALSVIFINVPVNLLLSSGEQELVEIREWLQMVVVKDSFDACRLKAAQVLQLLVSQVNKEVPVSDK